MKPPRDELEERRRTKKDGRVTVSWNSTNVYTRTPECGHMSPTYLTIAEADAWTIEHARACSKAIDLRRKTRWAGVRSHAITAWLGMLAGYWIARLLGFLGKL